MSTPAGPLETLDLMHDARSHHGQYVIRVNEDIVHRPGALTRAVEIHVEIPDLQHDDTSTDLGIPFVYVLRLVRRGELWSIRDCDVSTAAGSRMLSHQEHIEYSRLLIFTRFWTAVGPWVARNPTDRLSAAEIACAELSSIPEKSQADATECLEEWFNQAGALKILNVSSEIDAELQRRLLELCSSLASHYIIGVAFDCNCGDYVEISYSHDDIIPDVDSSFTHRSTRTSRIRMALGALPVQMHFHVPLARVSSSYEVRIQTADDVYVHSQAVLRRVRHPTGLRYGTIPEEEGGVETWRRAAGGSSGHIFIASGTRSNEGLFIAIKVFERLPGSLGRTTLFAVGSAVTALALASARWATNGALNSGAASVGAAALSLITFAADAVSSESPSKTVVVSARISQILTAVLLFLLALWLAIPVRAGTDTAGALAWSTRVWVRLGWMPIIVALGYNAWWIYSRLRRSFRVFLESVPANHLL